MDIARQSMEKIDMKPEQFTAIMSNLATLNEGVIGINAHLTQLNSKVATQEANMNTVLLWKARLEGFTGAVNLGWSTVIALLSGTGLTIWYWIIHR